MSYKRNIIARVHRLGTECTVKVEQSSGKDGFGNPESSWVTDRTVYAVRSYQNKNTEVTSGRGDRHRDRPLFVVPKGDDLPDPPGEEDRIVYNDRTYEVGALTHYETHVEFLATIVRG